MDSSTLITILNHLPPHKQVKIYVDGRVRYDVDYLWYNPETDEVILVDRSEFES